MDLRRAAKIQDLLRKKVEIRPLSKKPSSVVGVDAAFIAERVIGCACLFSFPDLQLLEEVWAVRKTGVPYIPGFLSFREAPALVAALKKLQHLPDLLLADGQGIAHPRGLGLASHLGVILNLPSVGCAKSRLIGVYAEPGRRKGAWTPLKIRGKAVGAVLRTRDEVAPVFVSPGQWITLEEAVGIVLACTGRYRIPEPLRRADQLSKIVKKSFIVGDPFVSPPIQPN